MKVMDPNLKALDFRFMQQLTGQWSLVSGPSCQNTSEAEKAKEQAEFNLFSAKLAREVSLFEEHARKLKAFHAREHEDKVAANLLLKQKLAKQSISATNGFQFGDVLRLEFCHTSMMSW